MTGICTRTSSGVIGRRRVDQRVLPLGRPPSGPAPPGGVGGSAAARLDAVAPALRLLLRLSLGDRLLDLGAILGVGRRLGRGTSCSSAARVEVAHLAIGGADVEEQRRQPLEQVRLLQLLDRDVGTCPLLYASRPACSAPWPSPVTSASSLDSACATTGVTQRNAATSAETTQHPVFTLEPPLEGRARCDDVLLRERVDPVAALGLFFAPWPPAFFAGLLRCRAAGADRRLRRRWPPARLAPPCDSAFAGRRRRAALAS